MTYEAWKQERGSGHKKEPHKQEPCKRDLHRPGAHKSVKSAPVQMRAEGAVNTTGIPDSLKSRFEARSGLSFDDVKVHYNSPKPAQYDALAYTQGNQVFMSPGQERHLGHELGHVVQQKLGKVAPTGTIGGQPLNANPALEAEADRMGEDSRPVS